MLTKGREYYKPFDYPWAFEYYKKQQQSHWLPDEVPLHEDVADYRKMDDDSRKLLTQILRFFTQADTDVAGAYCNYYLPTIKPPEVRMMMSSFAAMEAVHMQAYSLLLDTLGFDDSEYQMFSQIEAMQAKHEFMSKLSVDTPREIAKTIAINSGLGEGVQLFSSFAILMNYPRHGLMKGTGQLVTWSVRDEDLHVEGMSRVFREFVKENPEIWDDRLKYEVYCAAERVIELEDAFIDAAFGTCEVPGLTPNDVKEYIRYIADRRLQGMGFKGIFKTTENPLPWMDIMLRAVEHTNFFENRATEYARSTTEGNWGDVFK